MSADATETPGFESALSDLEQRVRKLEAGDVPLEDALKLYEEGVALARTCHEQLDAAEQRIVALSRGAEGLDDNPLAEPE